MRARSGFAAFVSAVVLALVAAGCGNEFALPTETPGGEIPEKGSYAYTGSLVGIANPTDVLLTLGTGSTIYVVSDSANVRAYPRFFRTDGSTPPLSYTFPGLFKPTKICQGPARVYVLDHGDTVLAKSDPTKAPGFVQFAVSGGNAVVTVKDTSFAEVRGIASDLLGNVYVSGIAKVFVADDPLDSRRRTYKYVSRIYRYLAAQAFTRDTQFFVDEGQGIGTVFDPGDCRVTLFNGTEYLYVADTGKDLAQRLRPVPNNGESGPLDPLALDGSQTGTTFIEPADVTADNEGFWYVVDTGNRRILRYDSSGIFIQKVNIELDLDADSLHVPIAASCDDSLFYVADSATGKVSSYKRRK